MIVLLLAVAVIFAAALIKATLGFGESLLAMPLLTLIMGLATATPLVGLVAATLTLLMLGSNWRGLDLRVIWRLLGAAALGVPIGILLLRYAPAALVTRGLGVVLIGFGLFSLFRPSLFVLAHPAWGYLFGATPFWTVSATQWPTLSRKKSFGGTNPSKPPLFKSALSIFYVRTSTRGCGISTWSSAPPRGWFCTSSRPSISATRSLTPSSP